MIPSLALLPAAGVTILTTMPQSAYDFSIGRRRRTAVDLYLVELFMVKMFVEIIKV